jgi:hypothetical protein
LREDAIRRETQLVIEISIPTFAVERDTVSLCYYRNVTNQVQIIRVTPAIPQRVEKVIFPGEQMLFHALSEASLDIYTNVATDLTSVERILCSQLQVIET